MCVVLDAMSERGRIFTAARAARGDRALSLDGAVLSGAVRLRAEDQPVADRDRAAALCAGVRSRRRLGGRSRRRCRRCRSTISSCSLSDDLYCLSYLRSLVVATVVDRACCC